MMIAVKPTFETMLQSAQHFGVFDAVRECYPQEYAEYNLRLAADRQKADAELVRISRPARDSKGRLRDKAGRFFRMPLSLRQVA